MSIELERILAEKEKNIESLEQAIHFEKERNYLTKERKEAVENKQQKVILIRKYMYFLIERN